MRDKWIVIIAVVALGGIGYLYYKDKQNASSTGTTEAASTLSIEQPSSIANSSIGSYVDPTGGLDYVDAVPVSVTSPTGFTAQDYNYGVEDESPISSNGTYDTVANPSGSGYTIVPTGQASLASYNQVVG